MWPIDLFPAFLWPSGVRTCLCFSVESPDASYDPFIFVVSFLSWQEQASGVDASANDYAPAMTGKELKDTIFSGVIEA